MNFNCGILLLLAVVCNISLPIPLKMYVCYLCGDDVKLESINRLRFHLLRHKDNCELLLPIRCKQGQCMGTYTTVFNLLRHISTHHAVKSNILEHGADSYGSPDANSDATDCACMSCDDDDTDSEQNSRVNFLQEIETEAVSLVAGLRANSSVPYSLVPAVVESFNCMSASMVSFVQSEVGRCLKDNQIDKSVVAQVTQDIGAKLEEGVNPLKNLSTRKRQDAFFDRHTLAVTPEHVYLCPRLESHGGSSSYVYDSFQYVPVKKTIWSLMQCKSYVEILLQDKCVPDVLQDWSDGAKCREHPLFGDCSKFSIKIQLFYDDMGVTNPLRSHGSVHNVGVFYYTIKNLPPEFNSCFANVHLLALCYSHDLSVHGFEPVLNRFVAEMKELSTAGLIGEFPILGHTTVYASLCQVTCDNLALNKMFGFIESFSGSYFCTICYATSEQIQVWYREEQFDRRTVDSYNSDIAGLQTAIQQGRNHCRGVKSSCKLNEIDGFHVVDNFSLDVMHIILEGIVSVELGCILHGLCEDTALTLEKINSAVSLLWGKMTVDKTHKPAEISRLHDPSHSIVPSMKAIQYWALLRYLPFAVGCDVPSDNKHWKFLLHLSLLVDLIFAPRFTRGMVLYMSEIIAEHLALFVCLYSNEHIRLRPKHHLLVHLPTVVLKSGPLIGMSCMRYELKNSFFKRSAHVVCNFTNICRTLAYRHQQHALYSLLSKNHIRNVASVTGHMLAMADSVPYCDVLVSGFGVTPTDTIAVANRMCVATMQYNKGHFLMLCRDEFGDPVFGKIINFVSVSGDGEWMVAVEQVQTTDFCADFHAFTIAFVEPAAVSVRQLNDFADHRPLYCHKLFSQNSTRHMLRLPYHIF